MGIFVVAYSKSDAGRPSFFGDEFISHDCSCWHPKRAIVRVDGEKGHPLHPLLDDAGKVVGLETLHGALHRPKYQNPVFLMAGDLVPVYVL